MPTPDALTHTFELIAHAERQISDLAAQLQYPSVDASHLALMKAEQARLGSYLLYGRRLIADPSH
jgi:hypothetical protein